MTEKKGRWARFLEWLAKSNDKQFGGKTPDCCGPEVWKERSTVHTQKNPRPR
jgi:hypothetical protein